MKILVIPKPNLFYAVDLDDAHKKGYFTGSMSRWELMVRLTKYNEDLRVYATKEYMGLWDVRKGFICGITRGLTIPQYTILRHDPKLDKKLNYSNEHGEIVNTVVESTDDLDHKVLARSWKAVFKMVERKGYKVDRRGL